MKALDRHLGRLYPTHRHYIFDSKDDGDYDDYPGRVGTDTCPPRCTGNQLYQVWSPVHRIPEEIEKWLDQILHDAPAILDVDELVHLKYGAKLYSPNYETIQKTGRSKHIITLTGTQALARIPPEAYEQATHRFGFYIDKAARYSRQALTALLKADVPDPSDEFGFYYQSEKGRGDPLYFSSIQMFLGQ